MIFCHLYRLIRFAISLLLPADKKANSAMYANLQWRTSLVDLCRLLDLNPSFDSRNDMFVKAGGKGVYHGSEEQNIWLHRQVMEGLAAHGFGDD